MTEQRWRQKVGEPCAVERCDDILVGRMRTPELAASVVADHNARLSEPQGDGGQEPGPVANLEVDSLVPLEPAGATYATSRRPRVTERELRGDSLERQRTNAAPVAAPPDQPVVEWTDQLEKARIELCEYLIDQSEMHDRRHPRLAEKLREAETALTLLGDIVRAALSRVPAGSQDEVQELFAVAERLAKHTGRTFVVDPAKLVAFREFSDRLRPTPPRDEPEGERG